MRKSIPGQNKRRTVNKSEEAKSRLKEKLDYGLGHYEERKILEEEKKNGPEIVKPGKARWEKPGYKRQKVKKGQAGLTAKAAQEKLISRLEKQQIDKGMEFIRDIPSKAIAISSMQEKFRALTSSGSKKTEEIVLEILNRVARGETVTQICRDAHMPTSSTVQKWIRTDPDFQQAFIEAREFQMNAFADQIIELADNSVGDIRLAFDKFGNIVPEVNYENVQRSKLRIDTRKWLMEKFYKKQYGKDSSSGEETKKLPSGNVTVQIMLPDNGRPILDVNTVDVE